MDEIPVAQRLEEAGGDEDAVETGRLAAAGPVVRQSAFAGCVAAPLHAPGLAGRACGCRGVTVKHADEYLPALREALASGEPTLLDVDTDPDAYPPITLFDDGKLEAVRQKRRQAALRKAA